MQFQLALENIRPGRSSHSISIAEHRQRITSIRRSVAQKEEITIDQSLDPDPYGLHGLSLAHRLSCMRQEFGETY